jgi:hypothetical protein
MAKLKGTHHVVTASFTESGAPAYLTSHGDWSSDLQHAHVIDSEERANEILGAALTQERLVSDPYTIMINRQEGRSQPLSQREAIRAAGPTTPLRRTD